MLLKIRLLTCIDLFRADKNLIGTAIITMWCNGSREGHGWTGKRTGWAGKGGGKPGKEMRRVRKGSRRGGERGSAGLGISKAASVVMPRNSDTSTWVFPPYTRLLVRRVARYPVFQGSSRISAPISRLPERSYAGDEISRISIRTFNHQSPHTVTHFMGQALSP